ncbi:hypothetical protein Ae201684P_020339 [Aphanomyces euteiches]|nr:hypothetical protein Ae201684P_020339 [Aphanomyces euteiches]
MGDEDLVVMLSNRDEQHLLHLVEVIGRYAANARLEERDDIALLHEESSRALKNQILDLEGQIVSPWLYKSVKKKRFDKRARNALRTRRELDLRSSGQKKMSRLATMTPVMATKIRTSSWMCRNSVGKNPTT